MHETAPSFLVCNDLIFFKPEYFAKGLCHSLFIFNQQNSHKTTSTSSIVA